MFSWGASAGNDATGEVEPEETPTCQRDYENLCQKTLEETLSFENRKDWSEIQHDTPDVKLFDLEGAHRVHSGLATGDFNCSAQQLAKLIWDMNEKERKIWDKGIDCSKIIEEITPTIRVVYSSYKAPFPVTGRDFVATRCFSALEDGAYVVHGKSILHRECPPVSSTVRGYSMTAFICRPKEGSPDKCKLIRLTRVDPKGMIPPFVVNMTKKKSAINFYLLRKAVDSGRLTLPPLEALPVRKAAGQPSQSSAPAPSPATPLQTLAPSTALTVGAGTAVAGERFFDCASESEADAIAALRVSVEKSLARVVAVLENMGSRQQGRRQGRCLSLTSLSWTSLLFLLAWPVVAHLLMRLFMRLWSR